MTSDDVPDAPNGWHAQSTVIYTALIGTGIVMVRPHLTSTDLGTPAFISLVAFSVAIPLVAALLLLGHHENRRHRLSAIAPMPPKQRPRRARRRHNGWQPPSLCTLHPQSSKESDASEMLCWPTAAGRGGRVVAEAITAGRWRWLRGRSCGLVRRDCCPSAPRRDPWPLLGCQIDA